MYGVAFVERRKGYIMIQKFSSLLIALLWAEVLAEAQDRPVEILKEG